LLNLSSHDSVLAWTAVLAGGIAAVIAVSSENPDTLLSIGLAVGIVGLLGSGYVLMSLAHDVGQAAGFANLAIGGWAAIGGSAAMIVGGSVSRSS
jgi:hypothetical protein